MCGIVGKIQRHPEKSPDRAIIERMKQCMVHRGPDEEGTVIQGQAGFGFRRLAIIDLASGQQPMSNEDGTCWIVFNGEIYNFEELRDELIACGHTFRTRSDTETILHGYEEWGAYICERLRGMFAFAIWDGRKRRLVMARDRVGKKPLYYAVVNGGTDDEALVFASELKCLLADPAVPRRLDPMALNHYLSLQYVPDPLSILKGVQKVRPGNFLVWEDGNVSTDRYWHLRYQPKIELTEDEAVEEWRRQLDEAVRIRLMSEVPLGCFLSGGLDSTAVVQAMRSHVAGDLRTFSIGFREDDHNELPFARLVSRKFETVHEEFIVEPDALSALGALAWHFDEPMADASAIPSYYLAQMTRRHVTVALNGDGGDESFAGYSRYNGYAAFHKAAGIPEAVRRMAIPVLNKVTQWFPSNERSEYISYLFETTLDSLERQYAQTLLMFPDYMKRRVLSADMRLLMNRADGDSPGLIVAAMEDGAALADIDRRMYADIRTYLPGALLTKMDRATMAHGVEARSPFLDQKLMEFAASLPAPMKWKQGSLKRLTKRVLQKSFPEDFIERPKQGFGVPLGKWLRGPLRPLMEELLLGAPIRRRDVFDMGFVESLVKRHLSGAEDQQFRLWTLMMFEAWARTFLDRPDPLAGPVDFTALVKRG